MKNIYSLSTKNINNPKLNGEDDLNNFNNENNILLNQNADLININKFLSGTNVNNLISNVDNKDLNNKNNTYKDPNIKEGEIKSLENNEEMVSAINKFLENINTNNKTPQT